MVHPVRSDVVISQHHRVLAILWYNSSVVETKPKPKGNTMNAVDTLGNLLAQIADLTAQAEEIKDSLKNGSDRVFEGDLFKATVIVANRSTVDYKGLVKALGIDPMMLMEFTRNTEVVSVKVTSR